MRPRSGTALHLVSPSGLTGDRTLDNRIVAALPAEARGALLEVLERVRLPYHCGIYAPGARIEQIYFPIDAVISLVTVMRDGTQIEVVTVGREGLTGAQAMLDGGAATQLTWCQVAGEAYRTSLRAFDAVCVRFPAVRAAAEHYVSAQLDALGQSIACNRLHYVNERCARWLLTTHDRVGRNEFPLTHDVLAVMLGVRRAGISIAAAGLQKAGVIRYRRGRFTVVDRAGLESAACECYGAIRDAFARRGLSVGHPHRPQGRV